MPFTLTMPKMSPTMEEGSIAKWHKAEGDLVEAGDLLMEVASDKATVEYNALDDGYLRKILISENGCARVGQAVAVFTESLEESVEGYEPEGLTEEQAVPEEESIPANVTEQVASPSPQGGFQGLREPAFEPESPLDNWEFEFPQRSFSERTLASPLARRIAKEKGLNLASVKGSGPAGRVLERDLEKAQASAVADFGPRDMPDLPPGSYEEEPLNPMRKTIGQRLQQAKTFIPHFYVSQDIEVSRLVETREELKSFGVKVTYNDFVVKAVAFALKEHPVINSGYNTVSSSIVRYKTIDIAIAVTIDGGLITPVLRHANYKNLGEISAEIKHLAGLARKGKLPPEAYRGGSFTISNLGMYGISEFQAVINPPQAAILAISGIEEKPVVKDGKVTAGKVLNVSLSSDHRVIDGAAAAEFLRTLKGYLEKPSILIL